MGLIVKKFKINFDHCSYAIFSQKNMNYRVHSNCPKSPKRPDFLTEFGMLISSVGNCHIFSFAKSNFTTKTIKIIKVFPLLRRPQINHYFVQKVQSFLSRFSHAFEESTDSQLRIWSTRRVIQVMCCDWKTTKFPRNL